MGVNVLVIDIHQSIAMRIIIGLSSGGKFHASL